MHLVNGRSGENENLQKGPLEHIAIHLVAKSTEMYLPISLQCLLLFKFAGLINGIADLKGKVVELRLHR